MCPPSNHLDTRTHTHTHGVFSLADFRPLRRFPIFGFKRELTQTILLMLFRPRCRMGPTLWYPFISPLPASAAITTRALRRCFMFVFVYIYLLYMCVCVRDLSTLFRRALIKLRYLLQRIPLSEKLRSRPVLCCVITLNWLDPFFPPHGLESNRQRCQVGLNKRVLIVFFLTFKLTYAFYKMFG